MTSGGARKTVSDVAGPCSPPRGIFRAACDIPCRAPVPEDLEFQAASARVFREARFRMRSTMIRASFTQLTLNTPKTRTKAITDPTEMAGRAQTYRFS